MAQQSPSKRLECSHKNMYTDVPSHIVYKSQNIETIHMPIDMNDEWTNSMQLIYTMGFYWVVERNEIAIHATTQVNLEETVPNERSQS